jgi:DNA mismatch repair protein MutS
MKLEEKTFGMKAEYKYLKGKHPDCLLLLRNGDFYYTFREDAKEVSEILGIALQIENGNPKETKATFPYQALDIYLPKLIRAGKRVAIAEYTKGVKERVWA